MISCDRVTEVAKNISILDCLDVSGYFLFFLEQVRIVLQFVAKLALQFLEVVFVCLLKLRLDVYKVYDATLSIAWVRAVHSRECL